MASRLSESPGQKSASPRPEDRPKARELATRACDACRARRRKCVFSPASEVGALCTGCSKLGIHCSFAIPTRPRGPKRKRKQASASPLPQGEVHSDPGHVFNPETSVITPSPGHPANARSHPDLSYAHQDGQSRFENYESLFPTDELCSRDLFMVIMADFIDRIYPLIPVVHLPTFRRNLKANRDINDTDFLSLTIALATVTIALLPSRFNVYGAMDPSMAARFPTRTAMISYCSQMCLQLRSPDYWDEVSHCKWAISFTLSMGVFHIGQTNHSRMLEAEAMQLARLLGLHRVPEYEGLNCIEKQLRKKAFWLTFYTFVHSKVQPGRHNHVTYLDNYMLRDVDFKALEPLNVVDEHILETDFASISPEPLPETCQHSTTSLGGADFTHVSAFIVASRIFLLALRESLYNDGCDCGYGRTQEEKLSRLKSLFHELKYALDGLPPHMRQWAVSENYKSTSHERYDSNASVTLAHVQSARQSEGLGGQFLASNITHAQDEIARANIHVSHLWFQNFLLDKMDEVIQEISAANGGDAADISWASSQLENNWREREDICRQLLHVLHSIPHAYLEPNGNFLTYKIRGIATSLLNCPFSLDAHMAQRATGYVREFTKVLSYLDHSEIVNTDGLDTWVDRDRDVGVSS